jgi:competence protein ComEA
VKRRDLLLALPLWAVLPSQAQAEVEVNTATRAELESLPGLGPALVQRLLGARPFTDWQDLMQRVPGVKAAAARKLSAAGLRVAAQPFSATGSKSG